MKSTVLFCCVCSTSGFYFLCVWRQIQTIMNRYMGDRLWIRRENYWAFTGVVTFLFQKILQLKDCRHWSCVATYTIYMKCVRDVNLLSLEKQNYCTVRDLTIVPYQLEKQIYCIVREVTIVRYQLEKQNYCVVREVTLALFRIVTAVRLAFALVVAHKCAYFSTNKSLAMIKWLDKCFRWGQPNTNESNILIW